MNLSNFVAYVKQAWKNKPDTSTPLSAERLTHQEEGIKGNSDAIQELAAAVVSQIVNNPDKIASMAALYAVNQKVTTLDGKVGDTAQLPSGTADVASAVAQLYSNLKYLNGGYSARITRIKNIQINDYYVYIDLDTSDLPTNKKLSEYPMILVAVNTNTVAEPILYADRAGDRKIRIVFARTITGTINLCLQYSVSPV